MLIACPTCGRLQFDMDTVVAEIEERLRQYDDPIEVAVLGCAVNGIGEASHADFGITGAKNEGLIFAHGKPLRKVPQDELVDALFEEIDKSIDRGTVEVDERKAAEGAEWLEQIEEENAGELTPERIAAMEAAAATEEALGNGQSLPMAGAREGQANHAGRGRLADGGAPLYPRLGCLSGRLDRLRARRREAKAAMHRGGARAVDANEVLIVLTERLMADLADWAGLSGHNLREVLLHGMVVPLRSPCKTLQPRRDRIATRRSAAAR